MCVCGGGVVVFEGVFVCMEVELVCLRECLSLWRWSWCV